MVSDNSILSLNQPAFMAALDELGISGQQRDFLIREKRKHDSLLGGIMDISQPPAGQKRATILPMVSPEGMTGWDAITSGQASLAVPGFLLDAIGGAARAVDAPRAAYAGQIPQSDIVGEGLGVGGLLSLGGAASAGRSIMDYDPTVTRIFAGPRAANADLKALDRAKRLSASNKDRDEIWNETGWFKLPDGQWRFEIPDNDVGLRPFDQSRLMADEMMQTAKDIRQGIKQRNADLRVQPDLFPTTLRKAHGLLAREADNLEESAQGNYGPTWNPSTLGQRATYAVTDSELQRAYPELMRDTIVRTDQNLSGSFGEYNEGLNRLGIAPSSRFDASQSIPKKDKRGTLLHELQHAIQGYEGFARGSNKNSSRELLENIRERDIKTERDAFSSMFFNADPSLRNILRDYENARKMGLLNDAIDLEVQAFQIPGGKELIEQSNRVLAASERRITGDDAFNAYERHLGELEARLVADRANWSNSQRKAVPPWAMSGYLPEDTLINSFIPAPTSPRDIFPSIQRGLLE
jgi:hypothetical protein